MLGIDNGVIEASFHTAHGSNFRTHDPVGIVADIEEGILGVIGGGIAHQQFVALQHLFTGGVLVVQVEPALAVHDVDALDFVEVDTAEAQGGCQLLRGTHGLDGHCEHNGTVSFLYAAHAGHEVIEVVVAGLGEVVLEAEAGGEGLVFGFLGGRHVLLVAGRAGRGWDIDSSVTGRDGHGHVGTGKIVQMACITVVALGEMAVIGHPEVALIGDMAGRAGGAGLDTVGEEERSLLSHAIDAVAGFGAVEGGCIGHAEDGVGAHLDVADAEVEVLGHDAGVAVHHEAVAVGVAEGFAEGFFHHHLTVVDDIGAAGGIVEIAGLEAAVILPGAVVAVDSGGAADLHGVKVEYMSSTSRGQRGSRHGAGIDELCVPVLYRKAVVHLHGTFVVEDTVVVVVHVGDMHCTPVVAGVADGKVGGGKGGTSADARLHLVLVVVESVGQGDVGTRQQIEGGTRSHIETVDHVVAFTEIEVDAACPDIDIVGTGRHIEIARVLSLITGRRLGI